MTNITLFRVGELIRTVFELLWNRPDGLPAREIIALVPGLIQLMEYEQDISPLNGISKYEEIIRMASVPLAKVGWLTKSDKGRWYLTEQGRQACKKYPNALELYKDALRLFEGKSQGKPEIMMAFEIAQDKAWDQIQKFLQETELGEFQRLVKDLLTAMNYHVLWSSVRPDKDHRQVDMVASVDPVGANGIRILVQIRHKGQVVTFEGLKTSLALLGPNDFGLLISTGGFTSDVLDEIRRREYQRINALDLVAFFDLWIRHYDRLSQDARNRLPIKPIHFLAPPD